MALSVPVLANRRFSSVVPLNRLASVPSTPAIGKVSRQAAPQGWAEVQRRNPITPRGAIGFLRWASAQPWGAAWRETLPIAGVDGTLANRFKGTTLEKRLFAKTGTLNATNALSGYMVAKSGRTLFFSAYANDVPESVRATRFMDAALEMIAEAN